mmetsp:Transcript_19401/g.42377  ORF Transcript_19401/g.42377 Transcript_19401/m.42377 type:complete len:342 (-) Transcript_19401:75-1100(-)
MGNSECVSERSKDAPPFSEEEERSLAGEHVVELAASVIFEAVPGVVRAYHTSVLVDGEEYFFSDSGICCDFGLVSHEGVPSERIELGRSCYTGLRMYQALDPAFRPGSYDLLRKNCNSFSDCALAFLLRKRLDWKYMAMERFGQGGTSLVSNGTVSWLSSGAYAPNPAADGFSADATVKALEEDRTSGPRAKGSKGPATEQRRVTLFVGAKVRIVGLKGAAELNGQGAEVVRYNPVNGRWEVLLRGSCEIKALRAENLRPLGEALLAVGSRVKICRLDSEAGQALNGTEGEVVRYIHDGSRYEVLVGNQTKALKSENLCQISDELDSEALKSKQPSESSGA